MGSNREMAEEGLYFKNIYGGLIGEITNFPNDDTRPNLQECISPMPNFHRAVKLAKLHNLPSEIITQFQELSIYQFLVDYQNTKGLNNIIEEYNINRDTLYRIISLIEKEKTYPCYSYSAETEWAAIRENLRIYPWLKDIGYIKPKREGIFSKFLSRLKRLFRRNK